MIGVHVNVMINKETEIMIFFLIKEESFLRFGAWNDLRLH